MKPIFTTIACACALLSALPTFASDLRNANDQAATRNAERTAINTPVPAEVKNKGGVRAARSQPRVIGGSDASVEGQWEFTVKLAIRNGDLIGHCGGAIISPDIRGTGDKRRVAGWREGSKSNMWILTAAHCIEDDNGVETPAKDIKVIAGVRDLQDTEKAVVLTVQDVFPHPNYDPSFGANFAKDIALLRLKQPNEEDISGSPLKSITLPSSRDRRDLFRAGVRHQVNGWGVTNTAVGTVTNFLQTASIPFLDQEACYENYQAIFGDIATGAFCAGWTEGGIDSCGGDSGGPIFFGGGTGAAPYSHQPIVTGVVSWGKGCAEPGFPGIYTDVFAYKTWIETVVAQAQ